jgi:pimeloyl-ACP methyl ester carboxylesterase
LQKLGVDRAHVVGHSSGGLIATQLALDAPELVGTLALLEPVDLEVPSAAEFGQQVLGAAFQRYAVGDKEGAVDAFMRGVCSPDHRPLLDRVLGPAAFRQAVTDADTFFGAEAPAGMQWRWDQIDPFSARNGAPRQGPTGLQGQSDFLAMPRPHQRPRCRPSAGVTVPAACPYDGHEADDRSDQR